MSLTACIVLVEGGVDFKTMANQTAAKALEEVRRTLQKYSCRFSVYYVSNLVCAHIYIYMYVSNLPCM